VSPRKYKQQHMFSALRCANLLKSKTSPAVFALPLLGKLH
jgi:hypothetical protein